MENALVHKSGDVSALAEHINLLHKDRGMLERLRAASLATVADLTWSAAGRILLDVYRETIEAHKPESVRENTPAPEAISMQ
jgi:glycosyltransferase involved in cell wall biosynthesis